MATDAPAGLLAVKAVATETVNSSSTNASVGYADVCTDPEATCYLKAGILHLQTKGRNGHCMNPS